MAKLIGIKRFVSKKGANCTFITVVSPYNSRQNESGCVGSLAEELFLNDSLATKVSNADIGKDLNLQYEVVGNRAYLIDLSINK